MVKIPCLQCKGAGSVPVSLTRDGRVKKKEHSRMETGREEWEGSDEGWGITINLKESMKPKQTEVRHSKIESKE